MKQWHVLIPMIMSGVVVAGCGSNSPQTSTPAATPPDTQPTTQPSGRSISANWIATFEHETMQEAIGVAIIDGVAAVSDPQAGAIHLFSLNGQRIGVWSPRNETVALERPMHVAADKKGRLYVADYGSDQVLLFARDGSLVMSFGTSGSEEGRFDAPAGVAVGDDGSIYVADFNNHRVQRFDAEGRFVQRWGREGHEPGDFYYPTDVAVGPEDRVYVADAYNHRVQVFTPDGTFVTAWGRQGSGLGEFDVRHRLGR